MDFTKIFFNYILNMTDKTTLLEAIDAYEFYTKRQRHILKTLVSLSVDNIVHVKCTFLNQTAGITLQAVYSNLRKFEADGFITRLKRGRNVDSVFKLNQEKLEHILKLHETVKTTDYSKFMFKP